MVGSQDLETQSEDKRLERMAFMLKFLHTLLMIQKDMGWLNSIKAREIQSIEEKPANPKSNYAIPGVSLMDLPLNVLRT